MNQPNNASGWFTLPFGALRAPGPSCRRNSQPKFGFLGRHNGPIQSGTLCAHKGSDMDGLTLLVLLALASTLAMVGARAVLGAVLHLMTSTLAPAPVHRSQDPTAGL